MGRQLRPAEEISAAELLAVPDEVLNGGKPVVLKGAVNDWPLVAAARQSDQAAADYIQRFYNGRPVRAIVAPASEQGRFFYRADSKMMNFDTAAASLSYVLSDLLRLKDEAQPPGVAVQAVLAAESLPGLEVANPNRFVPSSTPARLWFGNRVTIAPHFDVAGNLACVAAGRRRFTLFPPEQTGNIYPGPMDVTPAGVPISMVAMGEPELDRFPRYGEAADAGFVAELDPGDAVYVPYLWWHGVESLSDFNILVNYWWNGDAASGRYPYMAFLRLAHALFSDMPDRERLAWRALYDHYVFRPDGDPMAAIDPHHRESERQIDDDGIAALKQLIRDLLAAN